MKENAAKARAWLWLSIPIAILTAVQPVPDCSSTGFTAMLQA